MNLLQKITSLDCDIMELQIKKRKLEQEYAEKHTKYKLGDIVKVKMFASDCIKNTKITMICFDSTRLMYYHGIVLKTDGTPARRNGVNIADDNHYYKDIIVGFVNHSTPILSKRRLKND